MEIFCLLAVVVKFSQMRQFFFAAYEVIIHSIALVFILVHNTISWHTPTAYATLKGGGFQRSLIIQTLFFEGLPQVPYTVPLGSAYF